MLPDRQRSRHTAFAREGGMPVVVRLTGRGRGSDGARGESTVPFKQWKDELQYAKPSAELSHISRHSSFYSVWSFGDVSIGSPAYDGNVRVEGQASDSIPLRTPQTSETFCSARSAQPEAVGGGGGGAPAKRADDPGGCFFRMDSYLDFIVRDNKKSRATNEDVCSPPDRSAGGAAVAGGVGGCGGDSEGEADTFLPPTKRVSRRVHDKNIRAAGSLPKTFASGGRSPLAEGLKKVLLAKHAVVRTLAPMLCIQGASTAAV